MLARDLVDGLVIRRQPVKVHGNDHAGLELAFALDRFDLRFQMGHVDVAGMGVDIDEHWRGTGNEHRIRRRIVRKARDEDGVVRLHVLAHERDDKRVCAARDSQRMLCTGPARKLRFKLGHFRATDEGAVVQDLLPALLDVRAQHFLRRFKIEETDRTRIRASGAVVGGFGFRH